MPSQRIRSAAWLLTGACLALLCGCGSPPAGTGTAISGTGKGTAAVANPPATPAELKAAATKFATDFAKAVKAKAATPVQLSADFKKVIAPPVLADDAAKGYSDVAADTWLKNLAADVADDKVSCESAATDSAFAVLDGKTRTYLRLVRTGGNWSVDWLVASASGPAALIGDDAPAQFVTVAFLTAVVKQQGEQLLPLLSPAAQRKFGEDVFDKSKISPAVLKSNLDKLFAGSTAFTIATVSKTAAAAEVVSASGKKTATLKLTKGTRPGEWLIDDIDVK